MTLRSRRYGWYVLGLFATLNFFNYAARNVVLPMYDDLRAAFAFTNAELGLLTTSFMTLHALAAIPAGWAADHFDRRRVVAAGAVVWAIGALGCAAAAGVDSMLLARAVAGFGTGALVPVANALLCDVFPPEQKARTVSVFNVGLFLGGAGGFLLGALWGFPLAILVTAVPPLALAYLAGTLDVPARRASVQATAARMSWGAFARDALAIVRIRTMRWLLAGAVLSAFAAGGYLAWFVDFVTTAKGLSLGWATAFFGACALSGGLAGVVTGGVVGDRLYRRVPYGRMAAMSIGFLAAIPAAIACTFVDGGLPFYVGSWLMMFFIPWYHGPLAAVVDDLVADEQAATAQAGLITLMHLVGTAPSAYLVGLIADAVGLRIAMLVPTLSLLLAALAFMGGWRSVGADTRAASVRAA